jgi:RNA ligase (TIGR02306 family)
MSYFAVEKKKIGWTGVHTNADKLSLAKVEGIEYQFVTGKDEFKVGDDVVYFPIDSVLPKDLIDHLNIANFLTGKNHDRVKTVKLRGEYSQGLCVNFKKIDEFLQIQGTNNMSIANGDYTAILGVTKYEPPPIMEKSGNLVRLPDFVSVYDIEGCDNFPDVVAYLMDKKVWVSEKMEGTNFSVSYNMVDNKVYVNQRHHSIKPIDAGEHTFWRVAKEKGLIDLVKEVFGKYKGVTATLRGELIGSKIQGDYYDLKGFDIKLYEAEINGDPIDAEAFLRIMKDLGREADVVPTLAVNVTLAEFLNGKTVREASDGKSLFKPDKLREGIVIKPMKEERVEIGKFKGRLFIKQRSPEYLSKTEN